MYVGDRFARLAATRIVGEPHALDGYTAPDGMHMMRLAPDDLLVIPALSEIELADPHAVVEPEAGFSGAWFEGSELARLQGVCSWEFPRRRPAFAQGQVAGLPAKLLFDTDRVLVVIPSSVVHSFVERIHTGVRSA